MATKVVYTGTADFQEFSAADFQKADIEDQKKVVFAKGEAVEVSDAAAEALTSNEGIFGGHSFELEKTDEPDSEADAGEDKASSPEPQMSTPEPVGPAADEVNELATDGDEATTEGTAEATAAPATKTGRGSSTRSKR